MLFYKVWLQCVFLAVCVIYVQGGMTKDKMYERIDGMAACFRRLNGTHQIGCTSDIQGSTGVIHVATKETDLDWLITNGTAGPYIPLIPPTLFTRPVLTKLQAAYPTQITGVVLRSDTPTPDYFSHDQKCPNDRFALEGTCDATKPWNPFGTGLMFEDFPFPIFYVTNSTDIKKIEACFNKFNNHDLMDQRHRSLCALELKSFMSATTDAKTCIRRSNLVTNLKPVRFCDPLGDRNIWGTLFPRGAYAYVDKSGKTIEVPNKMSSKVIVIGTRLDGTSMFDGITPGASSPISGLVTLLTTAHILKQITQNMKTDRNLLFVILNGESYDYIGSQRIVYDMKKGIFPMEFDSNIKYNVPNITLDDISLFIELSQLSKNVTFFHMDSNTETNEFISKFKASFNGTSEITTTIPPSSLQTFLRSRGNISGVVLADHGMEFSNHYYHSIFDTAEVMKYKYFNKTDIPEDSVQSYLGDIAQTLALTMYELLAETKFVGALPTDIKSTVDELLYCYLISPNCKIFRAATFQEVLPEKPLPLYVGVDDWYNSITSVTGFTLGLFLGDIDRTKNISTCVRDPQIPVMKYMWMQGWDPKNSSGVCIRTTVNFTRAKSPAFDIEGYDWASGEFSTWTESTWKEFSMQIFLKPSAQHENVTMAIGTAILIISFIMVYYMNKKADILFQTNANIIGTSC